MVSIMFFQVAAAVIPTILIAYAITGNMLEKLTEHAGEIGRIRGTMIVLVMMAVVSLEAICLATLATDKPTVWARDIVLGGIIAVMWYLFYRSIWAVVPKLVEDRRQAAYSLMILPTVVLIGFSLALMRFLETGSILPG